MEWDMKNRLNRIIKGDGRFFIMPLDYGYFQESTTDLEKPYKTPQPLL